MKNPIRVGNAPCSWGALEFDVTAEPMGYERVLDEMAQAGFEGTELGDPGFMPSDPARLRDELAARKLQLLAAFVPVALADGACHAAGAQTAVKTAELLRDAAGEQCFIVLSDDNAANRSRLRAAGRVMPDGMLGPAAWDLFAAGATQIALAVREQTGLRTVFHHHGAGYVETPAEVDELMMRTEPQLLGLCLDTGHFAFGGGDPVAAVRRFARRIWHVHFKDRASAVRRYDDYFDAIRQGLFCELGEGEVCFADVLRELEQQQYAGWIVVEQDVLPGMGTPLESAKRNRDFLASLGL